ncbi:MAG: hypothetical protein Q7S14_01105 [bacterium]|nr:hypothetical protein [bacterium]
MKFLAIIPIVALALAGYFFFQDQNLQKPKIETVGWKTYSEKIFTLKYPNTWQSDGKTKTIGAPLGASGGGMLSLMVNAPEYNISKLFCFQKENETEIKVDGQIATRILLDGVTNKNCNTSYESMVIVTVKKNTNKVDLVFGYENSSRLEQEKLFDQILGTFRFLDEK